MSYRGYLCDLLESMKPLNKFVLSEIPDIDQCIGTNRLLGEYYGKALTEYFSISDPQILNLLTDLSVLMRSYIVLDDYIKDNYCEEGEKEFIEDWLLNISERCIYLIGKLEGGKPLWEKYLAIYEYGVANYRDLTPFDATIKKCIFILLPLELKVIAGSKSVNNFGHFIQGYLFSLQLLDDYKDMTEDYYSLNNQNLFIRELNEDHSVWLLKNKAKILKSLLQYIENNLALFGSTYQSSKTIKFFLRNSQDWLRKNMSFAAAGWNLEIFQKEYEYFNVQNEDISSIRNVNRLEPVIRDDINHQLDISAESMHKHNVLVNAQ